MESSQLSAELRRIATKINSSSRSAGSYVSDEELKKLMRKALDSLDPDEVDSDASIFSFDNGSGIYWIVGEDNFIELAHHDPSHTEHTTIYEAESIEDVDFDEAIKLSSKLFE